MKSKEKNVLKNPADHRRRRIGLRRWTAVASAIGLAAAAVTVTTTPSVAASTGSQACPSIANSIGTTSNGLTLTGYSRIDAREADLTFTTAVLSAPTTVRILTPTGYDCAAPTKYPSLYLLHGSNNDHTQWTDQATGAAALTADYKMIVVMPETSPTCGYTNAYNGGKFGQDEWRTFHLEQLLPWIDSHYNAVADRSGRAIGGLSMGGGGAFSYAAQRPDLFTAALSFSGATDYLDPAVNVANATSPACAAAYGSPVTDSIYIRGQNPVDLAANLNGLYVTMLVGNGLPGPLDDLSDPLTVPSGLVEADVNGTNVNMHNALDEASVPHTFVRYGNGTHIVPYQNRDLSQELPLLADVFANPRTIPSRVTYTSVQPSYAAYGWNVSTQRDVTEFSTLRDADAGGFSLSGSGSAVVKSASLYRPNARLTVTTSNGRGSQTSIVTADKSGRITIPVVLGTSNIAQEYSPAAALPGPLRATQTSEGATFENDSPGTAVFTTKVTVRAS